MATKLANAERELAQLRTTSRSAEFELVGKQQVRLLTAHQLPRQRHYCCAESASSSAALGSVFSYVCRQVQTHLQWHQIPELNPEL